MSTLTPILAHGQGGAADGVSTLLALGLVLALNAYIMMGRRSPAARKLRYGLIPLGALMLVGIVTAGSWVPGSKPSKKRPTTTARLAIVTPENGATTTSDVVVRMHLSGGRIVSTVSTKLIPNAGHVHIYVDDKLFSMTNGLSQRLTDLPGGPHRVRAEFVATDHGPFKNPVTAAVIFTVART